MSNEPMLLSGNEAVARAARAAGVSLGTGSPGTPSSEILGITGIRAKVELVEPDTIERSAGKAKRVIDRRTQDRST